MDKEGNILVHRNIKGNSFEYFLELVEPYRHSLTVCCECTFNWYWLADACLDAGIEFVLGHALYMSAIHGFKTKNDKTDSMQIAHLLRTNLIPPAYVYPREKRAMRGLLRKRISFVWKRSAILTNLSMGVMTIGHSPLNSTNKTRDRWLGELKDVYTEPIDKISMEASMHMVQQFDIIIEKLDQTIAGHTRSNYFTEYNIIKTVPGIGRILALIIFYEVDDINRFSSDQDFLSYCRLVKGTIASAGKIKGSKGGKMGNGYLKYAFHEAAVLGKGRNPEMRKYYQRIEAKKGKFLANSILACKYGRAVYHMLKNKKAFEFNKLARRAA